MASLNTLRTKFGVVLSIIIAFALLAFIFSLKAEMGFSGNNPKVGVIDGDKIRYSEYYDQYEQMKRQSGANESDEQQSDMLYNATWQTLIAQHVFVPGFERIGLRVTEPERLAMISGEQPSSAFYNAFADPRTGQYDVAAVSQFLDQVGANAQAEQAWNALNEQARLERQMQKYVGLVKGGVYVNSLEVADNVNAANRSFSGKWIGKKYASVPDSLVTVSEAELKDYYKRHKNQYKQLPQRNISYVVFEVNPSDADMQALEEKARTTGDAFAAADDVKAFVRADRNGRIDERYLSAAQLADDEAPALTAGEMFGPSLKNNEWRMARVLETKTAPDSIGVKHIVLRATDEALADSLLNVLRGGADFGALAAQYSAYEATAANGGEVGVMPFSAFTGEFAEQLAGVAKGDIVKIASPEAIQLIQVYRADKPSKHYRVASIAYPVEASTETRNSIYSQAGTFAGNAKGSYEQFSDAASAAALTPRMAIVSQGERAIRGLDDSREIVRWAYGAKRGDLSEIFKVGKDYVVALLTGIDNNDYASLEKVSAQVRSAVLRDKKYAYIVAGLTGGTLDEQAASLGSEVADFEQVNFGSFFINGMGLEPRVLGAIAATGETGAVSAPVQGMTGVYVFRVDDIAEDQKQTAEGEKVRAQAMAEAMAQQAVMPAVQQMAEVQDLRGKYF